MKKLKIAFTGVFDIANYGDLLFPNIFREKMISMGLNVELFLFSPTSGRKALERNTRIFSLDQLEELHHNVGFDSIIVGGGALIHFNELSQIFPKSKGFLPYKISQTWVIPSLLAMKTPIHLYWNSPGVPFEFASEFHPLVEALTNQVEYLSVRNTSSSLKLEKCIHQMDRIFIVPDTVLIASQLIEYDRLLRIRNRILNWAKPYVVFHCNRLIPENELPVIIYNLVELKKMGFEVILLPLAYTHDDQSILMKINNMANNQFIFIKKVLNIYEMMSIIAGSELYIGISFHGAITAFSYGKKAIGYNYLHYEKTSQLFNLFHSERYCIDTAELMQSTIEYILKDNAQSNLNEVTHRINEHFDRLYELLTISKSYKSYQSSDSILLSNSFSNFAKLRDEIDYLRKQNEWYSKDNNDLRNRLSEFYK